MIRKKILFATNYSAHDQDAFQVACRLANAWKATLLVVHVDESQNETADLSPRLDPNQKLFQLRPGNLDTRVEHILRHGDPADEILDIEKNRNVVLIVLGTHGRKGIQRMLSGSVAEKVIRGADCPVMTLRETDSKPDCEDDLTRILLPIDFSVYGYAALDFAASMAKSLNGEITILHVDESSNASTRRLPNGNPESKKHESELWSQLKKFKPKDKSVRFNHKLLPGNAVEQIPKYANSRNYDFIVLGTHGRGGLGRTLLGSVAEQVVRNVNCPVITVKPTNKRTPALNY